MKSTQITIRFDAAKFKALEFYLPQSGTTVEDELKNRLDEIYNNQVPDNVKEFIRFQSSNLNTGALQTEKVQEQSKAHENDKPAQRHKSKVQKSETDVQVEEPAISMNL